MAEKKKAKMVEVEAIDNGKKRWIHKGKEMKPGNKAEVAESKVAGLKEKGFIK